MQKLKINSKNESGMALVFTLMAILILSFVAATLLKTQTFVSKVQNLFVNAEVSADSTDFCLQAAFDHLKLNATNNTLNTNTSQTIILSSTTQKSAAFAIQSRFSASKNTSSQDSCTITFIREDFSASGGYGSINAVGVKYYRLKAIRDNGSEVVEYQTVLAI